MPVVLATVKEDAAALARAMALLRMAVRRARRHRAEHEEACEDIRTHLSHVRLLVRALQPAPLSTDDVPADASALLSMETRKRNNARRYGARDLKG